VVAAHHGGAWYREGSGSPDPSPPSLMMRARLCLLCDACLGGSPEPLGAEQAAALGVDSVAARDVLAALATTPAAPLAADPQAIITVCAYPNTPRQTCPNPRGVNAPGHSPVLPFLLPVRVAAPTRVLWVGSRSVHYPQDPEPSCLLDLTECPVPSSIHRPLPPPPRLLSLLLLPPLCAPGLRCLCQGRGRHVQRRR